MKRIASAITLIVILTCSAMNDRNALADNGNTTNPQSGPIQYSSAFLAAHPGCAKPRFSDHLNCEAMADLDGSDSQMKSLYEQQYAHLQSKDAKEYLAKTQLSWISYRDAQCSYEMRMWVTLGAERNARYWYCQSRKNKQRIELLKSYVACSDNDCPK